LLLHCSIFTAGLRFRRSAHTVSRPRLRPGPLLCVHNLVFGVAAARGAIGLGARGNRRLLARSRIRISEHLRHQLARGIRRSLLDGARLTDQLPAIGILLGMGVVMIPLSILVFSWAENRAKRLGLLKRSG